MSSWDWSFRECSHDARDGLFCVVGLNSYSQSTRCIRFHSLFSCSSHLSWAILFKNLQTAVKTIRGERFLKIGRDELWRGEEAEPVKSAIWTESGRTLPSADSAFDYCLTRIGDRFSKRDVFLATSDFARSFLVFSVCGIAPAIRLTLDRSHSALSFVVFLVGYMVFLAFIGRLAWIRMIRFRRMSDVVVFRAYLGSRPIQNSLPDEKTS